MKLFAKAIGVACLCIGLSIAVTSPAQAQNKRSIKNNANVQRNTKADPALAQAAKLTLQAKHQLQRGLPIYDGHRVLAIQIADLALTDMRMAHRQDRKSVPQKSARSQVESLGKPKEVARKQYAPNEIASSNKLLVEARGNLVQARASLGQSRSDDAYRAHAIELINYAIHEIDAALSFVNAR